MTSNYYHFFTHYKYILRICIGAPKYLSWWKWYLQQHFKSAVIIVLAVFWMWSWRANSGLTHTTYLFTPRSIGWSGKEVLASVHLLALWKTPPAPTHSFVHLSDPAYPSSVLVQVELIMCPTNSLHWCRMKASFMQCFFKYGTFQMDHLGTLLSITCWRDFPQIATVREPRPALKEAV